MSEIMGEIWRDIAIQRADDLETTRRQLAAAREAIRVADHFMRNGKAREKWCQMRAVRAAVEGASQG